MVLVDRALRCCGLVEGCGGVMAPSSKVMLLTTMMDALADKPDWSDTKLQLEATETAHELQMLAASIQDTGYRILTSPGGQPMKSQQRLIGKTEESPDHNHLINHHQAT